jgi:threonine efflux protein
VSPAVELAAFAGLMALGQFSPGPDMILLTRTALAEGAKAGAIMAISIAVAGLAVAFEKSPGLRQAISWAAAAYLLWLSWCLLKSALKSPADADESPERPAASGNPYVRGFICNLLNPKAVIFIAATCAPFMTGEHPPWWPFAIGGLIIVQGGALWALWARLLQWRPLRTRYEKSARWIDGIFGTALAALAVKLLVAP